MSRFLKILLSSVALGCLMCGASASAEDVRLNVIVSVRFDVQMLTLEQSGSKLKWQLSRPSPADAQHFSDWQDSHGEIDGGDSSILAEFESLLSLQTDAELRKEIASDDVEFLPVSVVLHCVHGRRSRLSYPLSHAQHKTLASSVVMNRIKDEILARRILLKPDLMLDFFDPERRPAFLRQMKRNSQQ